MKASELESKIEFREFPISHNLIQVEASIRLVATAVIDKSEGDYLERVRSKLKEGLMRSIYDDQRQELYDAVYELIQCNPMNHGSIDAARERLLKAAMRQG